MFTESHPHFLRRTFLTGLLILLPLFVTYVLIAFLFNLFTGVGAPLVRAVLRALGPDRYAWAGPLIPLVSLILSLIVIFLLGLVGTNILGRRVLAAFEGLLLRLPLVKTIYSAVKQMVDTFQGPGRNFQRVVLLQYPTKGLWMLGFVAAERHVTLLPVSSETMLAVFVPTTPNPTSGFLVLVAPEEVVDIDYSVEEAFKFIVSSGIVGKDLGGSGGGRPSAQDQTKAGSHLTPVPVASDNLS
ncbi:MAG TPA: DUF502 domain-containing protein [Candidatus Binatia bacterium]|jgi:uncharacterized membrane protein|nr:DUF502 domain-containing protein [Candidatus Binatia bacterium]